MSRFSHAPRAAALAVTLAAAVHAQPHPAPANPFCSVYTERDTVTTTLQCVNGVIDSITAFFGTPSGSCPTFVANASCNSPSFGKYATATCVGKQACTLTSAGFPDPCPEVIKTIAATAHCSQPPGGYGPPPPAPPLPTPSCALNGTACPPPKWAPQWNLTLSTIVQPSAPGYFIPPASQPWGLVSLDWSVAKTIWAANGLRNGTIEATSIYGCQLIKAISPNTRCFIYHNMELALEAMESQRAVMYDPTKAYMFLQYTDGQGHKNGTVYNEPGGPGDQYFWDFRVPDAADYYVTSVLNTTLHPAVDGTFTDDVTGFPAEHGGGPANIRMNASDVADVDYWTQLANARLIDAAVAAGKYVWQAFGAQDGVGSGPNQGDCASWMAARCDDAYQARAITQAADDAHFNQSLASFLITRPPLAWLGYGWESDMRNWRSEFLWNLGTPQGGCYQSGPAVFTRAWTYGNVTLDCASWQATIPVGP